MSMVDYEIEFHRLLDYSKQALSGVNIEKRKVLAFLPLYILDNVIKDYEKRLEMKTETCSYSDDGKHHFDGDVVEVCSYCEGRRTDVYA